MISFNSSKFYLFVLIAAFLFKILRERISSKVILFLINGSYFTLLFYYRKKHFLLMSVFLFSAYIGLKWLEESKYKKSLSLILIIKCLLFLFFFKYSVIQASIISILPAAKFLLKPAIFLGISFFSFRYISVVIDTASRDETDEKIDFFHLTNFLLFFPSFMMGPLDRYQRFVEDFKDQDQISTSQDYFEIWERMIWGAFKKVVIADTLLDFSSAAINPIDLNKIGFTKFISSHYIFYFALYFDFSGYCDIAISVGRLFGIKTPENFNHPYKARNIQEFWQRWHMSFMEWLKDYLYFPFMRLFLDISNKYIVTWTCLSFFLTFLIAGIWHGDGQNFLFYGMIHGVGFMVWFSYNHLLKKKLGKKKLKVYNSNPIIKFTAQFLTFNFFIFSLFWFLNIQSTLFFYLQGFLS